MATPLKTLVRRAISRTPVIGPIFLGICARFAVRLYAFQRLLSIRDLQDKLTLLAWRRVLAAARHPLLERIVLTADATTVIYRDDVSFFILRTGTSNSKVLLLDPAYEADETAVVRRIVQPGWTVIDAGSNFGWYTILLSRLVGPTGSVLAFEPVEESFAELTENVRLNRCVNVHLHQEAIGESTREVSIYVPEFAMGTGAASQHLDAGRKVIARMISLDALAKDGRIDRIDFIKADVEGGEFDLLRGAESLLIRHKPALLIEIVDVHCRRFGHSSLDVIRYLEALGYKGKHVGKGGSLTWADSRWPDNGNYLFRPAAAWNEEPQA